MKNQFFIFGVLAFLLTCFSVQAVLQYEVEVFPTPGQNWQSANQAVIRVTEGGSLWMMSKVSNYGGGSLPDLGDKADMTSGNYGAMNPADYSKFSGTGESEVMYFTNGSDTITNVAYYVGDFDAGDEIGLWLTDKSNGMAGHSLGPVQEGINAGLNSRNLNSTDLAGNFVFNFSFAGAGAVEFVMLGGDWSGEPIGQPLPGAMASLLLAGGTGAMLMRKKKRQEAKFL